MVGWMAGKAVAMCFYADQCQTAHIPIRSVNHLICSATDTRHGGGCGGGVLGFVNSQMCPKWAITRSGNELSPVRVALLSFYYYTGHTRPHHPHIWQQQICTSSSCVVKERRDDCSLTPFQFIPLLVGWLVVVLGEDRTDNEAGQTINGKLPTMDHGKDIEWA